MELFIAVLVLLVLIGLSNILNRFVPFIPIPLIQIVLGVAIALLPAGVHLPLNPELFFVLFIAPLLYNDGKRTPRTRIMESPGRPILLLALGLVFVTVVVAGICHSLADSFDSVACGLCTCSHSVPDRCCSCWRYGRSGTFAQKHT